MIPPVTEHLLIASVSPSIGTPASKLVEIPSEISGPSVFVALMTKSISVCRIGMISLLKSAIMGPVDRRSTSIPLSTFHPFFLTTNLTVQESQYVLSSADYSISEYVLVCRPGRIRVLQKGDEFLKERRLASAPGVIVHRPTPKDSVFDAPPGFFAIHLKSLEYGFRFPLNQLVVDFFLHFNLLPCQVVPKSHRYLAGFLVRCQQTGVHPDLARFLLLFRLAKSSGCADSDSSSYPAIFQKQQKLFKVGSEEDRAKAHAEVAVLHEELTAAKEQARQAVEEVACKAHQEGRDRAVGEFLASPAFQEEAFARMQDLLKSWGKTLEGMAFVRSEGTSCYNLGVY
ncbi:unnamed protein product [Cuscuta campestris]|uniref:Uncharacterized protein n=1 Tax=Cuscuta campestris TaxID=132261 RepID=A0A484MAV9_9ASTE|nr:unnamed protein product [Cuscuta campestris]